MAWRTALNSRRRGDPVIQKPHERFAEKSGDYDRFRPRYPADLTARLAGRILAVPAPAHAPVLDVGSGTGIFTRHLAEALPTGVAVLGVEPSAEMRETAARTEGAANIRYAEGFAENLPVDDRAARAIVAATAAHWFDRPAFYTEAARKLCPRGILAIIQYIRDAENGPAPKAVEEFLRENGGARVYDRPDYRAELTGLPGFGMLEAAYDTVTLRLTAEELAGLALSSSHARSVEARLGVEATREALMAMGAVLAGPDGIIPYDYRFELFIVEREPDKGPR